MYLILILVGIISFFCIFINLNFIKTCKNEAQLPDFTVVIPSRNEEAVLPLLLKDISIQTLKPNEIICVDDQSKDDTLNMATSNGAKVISVKEKPDGWLGKSYACHLGAHEVKTELIVFLDADVRLEPEALETLVNSYSKNKKVISVQPYHQTKKIYEQFSFIFNLIAASSLAGKFLGKRKSKGLFGPVILIPQKTYWKIGGHEKIRGEILDDISLGKELHKNGEEVECFLGGKLIKFRMYPQGIKSLWQGFIKNFAAGAMKSSFIFFILTFIWVSAFCVGAIKLMESIAVGVPWEICCYSMIYFLIVLELNLFSRKIGSFTILTALSYPLHMVYFFLVFFISLLKKLLRRPVYWKGRKV